MSSQRSKLPWKTSKQTKTKTDGFEETANKGEKVPTAPPPPYAESSSQDRNEDALSDRNTPYPLLTKTARKNNVIRRSQLHWVLVEIVAVTFSTDLRRLRRALLKTDHTWAPTFVVDDSFSMLDIENRALVAETCALVQNLEREMAHTRWLLVHPRDKRLVRKMVLEPVQELDLNLEFALELLGRFKRGQDCRRPESTLLSYWMASAHTTDRGDIMASYGLVIQSFDLKEEVRLVLEDYFAEFQKENGLEELCTSKELQEESLVPGPMCCWPLSDSYMDLARGVRALETSSVNDPYEPSRTRLRERRNVASLREMSVSLLG